MTSTPPQPPPPIDQAHRERILGERAKNLFVSAGAGSGKTRSLVDRLEALILEDQVPIENIAVVTFTDKAGMELRNRIRERLEATESELAKAALHKLDGAAVGTLHSFAQRILTQHPLSAGLPPEIEVLDEIGSQIDFEQRWDEFLSNEFLVDAKVGKPLLTLDALGVKLDRFRDLAIAMNENWDLVEQRLDLSPPPFRPFKKNDLVNECREVINFRRFCSHDGDKMHIRLTNLAQDTDRLANGKDSIEALLNAKALRCNTRIAGQKAYWGISPGEVRSAIARLKRKRDRDVAEVATSALATLGARLGKFVLDAAEQRRRAGRLQFHDLLVHSRNILRNNKEARKALHNQYTHFLLDEFQDTDPIQIEIAVLISTSEEEVGDRKWNELKVEPGRLFFVGDPKQSIYRFRRADIGLYMEAREHHKDRATLSVNFRTVKPIVEWVNDVFSTLFFPQEGSQPAYEPLSAFRTDQDKRGPAVALLGAKKHPSLDLTADDLRAIEAADVAATLREALGPDGWQVEDSGVWRRAVPDDVCILLPARTSLKQLQAALETQGIPYCSEAPSRDNTSSEVRELLMVLRVIADPTDELAIVSALRSIVYGCGDNDLASWKIEHGGRFSITGSIPEAAQDHIVAHSLAHLQQLHKDRHFKTPAELLERLIRERGIFEIALAKSTRREVWRRLRFVVDQARAWTNAGGAGLRAYIDWVQRQGDDSPRGGEIVTPTSSGAGVRIMTIHGSKGLEFPITVLSGMTGKMAKNARWTEIYFPKGKPAILKINSDIKTDGFDQFQSIEEDMDQNERLRLLYVAATRARDHLIVSLHRVAKKSTKNESDKQTSAEALQAAARDSKHGTIFQPSKSGHIAIPKQMRKPLADREVWNAKRDAAIASASRRDFIAATKWDDSKESAQDPGLAKHAQDSDQNLWPKGRYGTKVGSAVHGVLQDIDFVSRANLDELVAAQAQAEGVGGRKALIRRLVNSALNTEVARQAAASEHWREIWVGAPVGSVLVDGYIDLLIRTDTGLVVVDWKTGAIASEADKAEKLERYRLQGASYAATLQAATGMMVERMVFVFIGEDSSVECDLPDLPGAIAEVEERAMALSG